jgi:hypothetical protein
MEEVVDSIPEHDMRVSVFSALRMFLSSEAF